ncbi:MAG TPA: nicotinamide riboside transporter PnuC [Chiayiivirga sp.]|nr:nicotinamide riboside transporter PnuC [Chiayiivirga sp.]
MNWIELTAAITSALGVWLMAQRRPLAWPVGLMSVLIYAWVFIEVRLYSDALLQGAFAVILVYGWWRWLQNLGDDGRVRIAPLSSPHAALHVAFGALGAVALGAFMHHQTDAALPWLDAALAAFSMVAQWWQARRHIACWWLWIAVDVIYIGMYVHKDLWITASLYAGFLVLAVIGLRAWNAATNQR